MSSFAPKARGNYVVDVSQDGSPIQGSPFKISVGETQVASAGKVHISGKGVKDVVANEWNEFELNIIDAGECLKYSVCVIRKEPLSSKCVQIPESFSEYHLNRHNKLYYKLWNVLRIIEFLS